MCDNLHCILLKYYIFPTSTKSNIPNHIQLHHSFHLDYTIFDIQSTQYRFWSNIPNLLPSCNQTNGILFPHTSILLLQNISQRCKISILRLDVIIYVSVWTYMNKTLPATWHACSSMVSLGFHCPGWLPEALRPFGPPFHILFSQTLTFPLQFCDPACITSKVSPSQLLLPSISPKSLAEK